MTAESYQPLVKVDFSPFNGSHVVPFLCLLLKRYVKCSQIETDQLNLEASWMNTFCDGSTPLKIREEFKRTDRNLTELNLSK